MKIDEVVTLKDVLKTSQYIQLLKRLNIDTAGHIDSSRIKNQVMQSWKSGMKSRKHYDDLLKQINMSVDKLIH